MNNVGDTPNGQPPNPERDAWMRGYLTGHETAHADAAVTAEVVRDLQADAWDHGYTAGHADATAQARHNIAATLAELAEAHADIDAAFKQLAYATSARRVARDIADMTATAARQHQRYGTREWAGLDNGAALPSADWTGNLTPVGAAA